MRVDVHFRNTDATDDEKDALRARVGRKIRKVTRFLKEPIEVAMVIKGEKIGFYGDLKVSSAGMQPVTAKIQTDDPVAVIDGLIHTTERTARRNHDRVVRKAQKGPAPIDGFATPSYDLSEAEDEDLATAEIQRQLGS